MNDVTFTIEGMHCTSCSSSVERALRLLPGVESAAVDFASKRAQVRYDEVQISPARLVATVERAGFRAEGAE